MIEQSYEKMASGKAMWILSVFLAVALASDDVGEFTILHSPDYINFLHTNDVIDVNEVSPVISSYLGLALNSDIKWKGLAEGSPFHRPKAAVVLSVDFLQSGKVKVNHKNKYPMLESSLDFDSETVINYIQSLEWKTEPVFVDFSIGNSMVNLKSQNPAFFSKLPKTLGRIHEDGVAKKNWFRTAEVGTLSISSDADLQFLAELYMVNEILDLLKLHPKMLQHHSPDFFHFKISGLEHLFTAYGSHSSQVKDAVRLINSVVQKVTEDFKELYHDDCVVQLVGFQPLTGEKQLRRGRNLLEVEVSPNKTLNLAPEFTGMYPVTFNIILWTMIVIALSVYAISWGIWNMDPGRDSLIYRMTSQRKKND